MEREREGGREGGRERERERAKGKTPSEEKALAIENLTFMSSTSLPCLHIEPIRIIVISGLGMSLRNQSETRFLIRTKY